MKVFRVAKRLWRKAAGFGVLIGLLFTLIHLVFHRLGHQQVHVIGYACTGACGGWADRQKGIVAAYVMATLLDVEFKIHMPAPCDLGFFLSPRQLKRNWRLLPGELEGEDVVVANMMGEQDIIEFVQTFLSVKDPLQLFYAKYFFVLSNVEIVHLLRKHELAQRFPWLQGTIPEIYRYVLTELFQLRPGPRLVLDSFLASLPPGSKLACAQIRVGGSGDTETFNTVEHLAGLVQFLAPYNVSSYRFMFTSDKQAMAQHARAFFPSRSVELTGPAVTHVDRSVGRDVCGGFGRAIVEQQLLARCHVLVISESGLAKIAAFLRNTDDRLYIFHDGVVEKFERTGPFPNRVIW